MRRGRRGGAGGLAKSLRHVTLLPPIKKARPGPPRVCLARAARSRTMSSAQLAGAAQAAPGTVYGFSARPLAGGEPVSLGSLRGKVLLIENVASL